MPPRHTPDDSDDEMDEVPPAETLPTIPPLSLALCARVDPSLRGDRVSLPVSVLETIVGPNTDHAAQTGVITFSFTFGERKIFGSVLGFTEEEGQVGLSAFLSDALGCKEGDMVQISRVVLPKATSIALRPTSPGYSKLFGGDIRSVLEQHLRKTFATLTQGELLSVEAIGSDHKKHQVGFYIETISPSSVGGVLIIDVTVDLDILVPLDAAEGTNPPLSPTGEGGATIVPLASKGKGKDDDAVKTGEVLANQGPEASRLFEIPLEGAGDLWELRVNVEMLSSDSSDCEVYATTFSNIPTRTNHLFFDVSWGEKSLLVRSHDLPAGTTPSRLAVSVVTYGNEASSYKLSAVLTKGSATNARSDLNGSATAEEASAPEPAPGTKQCPNCQQYILERTMVMHESFCLRNNKRCSICGKVLLAKDFDSHGHCHECGFAADSTDELDKHQLLLHNRFECEKCGRALFLGEVSEHQRHECPERITECRYCHLLVRAGPNVRSGLDLISEHEDICRSRTISCVKCGANVKLMHVASHAKIHQMEKKSRPPLTLCANQNCDRPASTNVLKLCSPCFTPFYSPNHDPDNKKLAQRLIRAYFTQLTSGCNVKLCANEFCSSGGHPKMPANEAGLKAIELAKKSALFNKKDPECWLCVEGSSPATRARKIADWHEG